MSGIQFSTYRARSVYRYDWETAGWVWMRVLMQRAVSLIEEMGALVRQDRPQEVKDWERRCNEFLARAVLYGRWM